MTTKHGEYIALYWDGDPDGHYVRGHVTPEEGAAALKDYGIDPANCHPPSHEYGRRSMDANRADGCDWVLAVYKERGRGRFPITVYRPKPKGGAG